jgi:hypothetical protein
MAFGELALSAVLWATLVTLVSQGVSILVVWWLGLPPKKLVHEIEVVQNPAVGAIFFIITLTVSLFISQWAGDPRSSSGSNLEEIAWFVGGILVGVIYTAIVYMIAHRVMGRENNENVYQYLRREIIEEQNVSLAFFMGGLAFAPFIAVLYQIL